MAGATLLPASALLMTKGKAQADESQDRKGKLTKGDVAILRFLAAAEILELIFGNSITNSEESKTVKSEEGLEMDPTPMPLRFLMATWISTSTTIPRMSSPTSGNCSIYRNSFSWTNHDHFTG